MPVGEGLYWEEHGPRGADTVILSSGLGGSANYWTPNIAALAARYHVLAYDHRGTGRSERDVDGVLTIAGMATDVAALMDAAGVAQATVVGHAIGGMIGLELALARPDRVAAVVVVNGWGKLDRHTARCFDTRLTLLRDSGPRAYLHAQPLFLYPPQWVSDHHDHLAEEEEAQLAVFPGAEMIARRIAAARHFDMVSRMRDIAVPALFVASDDDMLVPPSCSERLAAGVPGAQLARMAKGGHACNVTRADNFNMWLLDWLDGAREDR